MQKNRPSREEYEEFLIQLVYGPCSDYLSACAESAYLDFCRTLRGFAKLPGKNATYGRALTLLVDQLTTVKGDEAICDQLSFDRWHKSLIVQIVQVFRDNKFDMFAGQAQKWINMALKNIFVCGDSRIPGFERLYGYCHMPIDNIILDALCDGKGIPRPSHAWSRWSYEDYLSFQKTLREEFKHQPLLNVEHKLWIEGR